MPIIGHCPAILIPSSGTISISSVPINQRPSLSIMALIAIHCRAIPPSFPPWIGNLVHNNQRPTLSITALIAIHCSAHPDFLPTLPSHRGSASRFISISTHHRPSRRSSPCTAALAFFPSVHICNHPSPLSEYRHLFPNMSRTCHVTRFKHFALLLTTTTVSMRYAINRPIKWRQDQLCFSAPRCATQCCRQAE
jgi:hypothetical protein